MSWIRLLFRLLGSVIFSWLLNRPLLSIGTIIVIPASIVSITPDIMRYCFRSGVALIYFDFINEPGFLSRRHIVMTPCFFQFFLMHFCFQLFCEKSFLPCFTQYLVSQTSQLFTKAIFSVLFYSNFCMRTTEPWDKINRFLS